MLRILDARLMSTVGAEGALKMSRKLRMYIYDIFATENCVRKCRNISCQGVSMVIMNERKYLRVVCVMDVGKHIINPNICERAKPPKASPKF